MPDAAVAFSKTNFTNLDWVIVVVYLLGSLAIGVMVKKYASSMTAYIGAGRSIGAWLGIATMTGTELGLVTVMYSAEKGFKGGFAAFHIAVMAGAATFVVGATGFIVVPLRRLKVLTIPEYYELRYSRTTRIVGGTVLALAGILNMGMFLKIGSMFIVGVTGIPQGSTSLMLVMTALLSLVLVYTVMGGMISVVITDYFQFVLLSFGLLLTTWLAIDHLGWDNIFQTVEERIGEKGFNPLAEGQFGPSYMMWQGFLGLIGCCVWPTTVARALAMESTRALKKQYMWSSVSFAIRFMIPYFWGICAFVFIAQEAVDLQALFPTSGEEIAAGTKPENVLMAMPVFLGRLLPAGVLGLITAAMIAAFMSTHDSYLLCWSSVITQDIVAPLRGGEITVKQRITLTRVLIVIIGGFLLAWGLFYKGGDDIWDYMAITGAVYFIGAFVLLAGGIYWRRASSTGAIAGLLASCTAILGLEPLRMPLGTALMQLFGQNNPSELARAAFTSDRVALGSVALTALVFVVVSLLFPDKGGTGNVGEAQSNGSPDLENKETPA